MSLAPAVTSMTGFAQTEGHFGPLGWRIELKSVNSKGFDLRCRTPSGFDAFEASARTQLGQVLKRGSVTLNVQLKANSGAGSARLNRALLGEVMALAAEIEGEHRLEHLLSVRGVIETEETVLEPTPELLAALDTGLKSALQKLLATRRTEGDHLKTVLLAHLDEVEKLTAAARNEASALPATLKQRLEQKLAELAATLPPERLAQEAALLATKADITEEMNRLEGHIRAMRQLLKEGGPIGRKLDFLCQELNREANTLCSKSESLSLTNIGVDLKVTIEQIREQVQNVE